MAVFKTYPSSIIPAAVDATELGYLDGVTSAIQTQLDGKVAKSGDTMTGNLSLGANQLTAHNIRPDASDGLLLESANGTDVGTLGVTNTANVSWNGSHNFALATQDTIAAFTGAGKTLGSLALATYPSLTELTYVKGVTSALQTQLDAKLGDYVFTPVDYGILAWNYSIEHAGSSTILPTAGLAHVFKVKVPVAITATNLHIRITSAGSGLSNSYMALYNSGGTLLSQSADQSSSGSNWQSSGYKTVPLGTPQAIAAGTYYVVLWVGTATTLPTLARNSNSTVVFGGLSDANSHWATADSGLTTTAPSTLGAFTKINTGWWAGIS